MGSKMVRLDEDVYERIKSKKRESETFSEAVDRLTSGYTLLDFAESEPAIDPQRHQELLADAEERDIQETKERLERMGIDVE